MEYAYGSDAGLYREINEDRVGVFQMGDVFTVAMLLDGMGGTQGGRIASEVAYQTMVTELELRLSFLLCESDDPSQKAVGQILKDSADAANAAVRARAEKDASLAGMGTTLVAAVLYKDRCCILNVGDSRGYYVSDGQICQITKDQSYLQYLLDHDRLKEKDIDSFAEKNVIMSAVGTEEKVKSDLYYLSFQQMGEEYLLLTSDGLHDLLSENDICRIVSERITLKEKIVKLITCANDAGGEDNISAVLVRNRKVGNL